jgi:hypothetical protein
MLTWTLVMRGNANLDPWLCGIANLKSQNDTIFKGSYWKTYGLKFRKHIFDDFMAMLVMLTWTW